MDGRTQSDPLTCIHQDKGLCAACQADYEADPLAWLEYGNHTAGIARWQETLAQIAADIARADATPPAEPDPEIPF